MAGGKCSTLLASLVLISGAAILNGCGGSTNVQNAPAPPSTPIAIAFQPSPPSAIHVSSTTTLTAVVKNDPNNSGVDWNLICQSAGNCGSLTPPHTTSGEPVTYTAPTTLSGNSQSVTIAAFATSDHSQNILSPMTVTAFGSALKGTYVIQTHGVDASGNPYQRAGIVVLDGNGGISSGEQTVNFVNPITNNNSSVQDPIVGGTYFVGTNGRGSLAINTNDVNIGQQGTETFDLVVLSASRLLLSESDNPNLQGSSGESSVGIGDLQTAKPTPARGYAFVTNGTDTTGVPGNALGLGGVFNIDAGQAISGTGSALDVVNIINGLGVVTSSSTLSGTVSIPDSFGAFQISLVTNLGKYQFTGYPVDGFHVKLIESDGTMGVTVGEALSQGSATGTYQTLNTFTGNYVFGLFGRDNYPSTPASLAAAGVFSTTGVGTLTAGYIDESQLDTPLQISDGFQASYAVGPGGNLDPSGTGRFYIPISSTTGYPDFTFSTTTNGTGPAWIFYLSGNGGPALMLDADVEPSVASGFFGGGVATGIAYPIASGATFSGPYGTIFTQNMASTEADSVAEISIQSNALSGIVDINSSTGPLAIDDNSLSGSFKDSTISDRLTGTLSDVFFSTALGTTDSLSTAYYPIDSTQGFFVENDLVDSSGNLISGDVTFGYYTARTPVCQGCP